MSRHLYTIMRRRISAFFNPMQRRQRKRREAGVGSLPALIVLARLSAGKRHNFSAEQTSAFSTLTFNKALATLFVAMANLERSKLRGEIRLLLAVAVVDLATYVATFLSIQDEVRTSRRRNTVASFLAAHLRGIAVSAPIIGKIVLSVVRFAAIVCNMLLVPSTPVFIRKPFS